MAIVGAGPVGCALSVALAANGKKVLLVDKEKISVASTTSRKIALTYGSKVILEKIGVWSKIESFTAINSVHVSHRGNFGQVLLDRKLVDLPALGYVLPYSNIRDALISRARLEGVHVQDQCSIGSLAVRGGKSCITGQAKGGATKEFFSDLTVIADGGGQLAEKNIVKIKEKNFNQSAIVGTVFTDQNHCNVAYERFTESGPIALLPHNSNYALVWISTPLETEHLLQKSQKKFLQSLQEKFGFRAGQFVKVERRQSVPIKMKYATNITGERLILLGNAAQFMHPVAAQGLNLGLRDVADLSKLIRQYPGTNIGNNNFLYRYRKLRRHDRLFGVLFTNFIVKLFSNKIAPIVISRSIGLLMLSLMPRLRKLLLKQMIFGSKLN